MASLADYVLQDIVLLQLFEAQEIEEPDIAYLSRGEKQKAKQDADDAMQNGMWLH